MNGQSILDKRGELRTQFYLNLMRKPSERVSDFASRFRTAVADLKAEGVKLPSPELGWFFRQKLGLDALRKQLLDTALQGKEEYNEIEAECLRLFKDLHLQDPLYRRAERDGRPPAGRPLTIRRMFASGASTSASSGRSSGRSTAPSSASASSTPSFRRFAPRQAQVTEHFDEEDGGEDVEDDGTHDVQEAAAEPDPTLEEVLQAEVENLADELAAAEEEGVDQDTLEALESGIEATAEALVSMREARKSWRRLGRTVATRHPPQPESPPALVVRRRRQGKRPANTRVLIAGKPAFGPATRSVQNPAKDSDGKRPRRSTLLGLGR